MVLITNAQRQLSSQCGWTVQNENVQDPSTVSKVKCTTSGIDCARAPLQIAHQDASMSHRQSPLRETSQDQIYSPSMSGSKQIGMERDETLFARRKVPMAPLNLSNSHSAMAQLYSGNSKGSNANVRRPSTAIELEWQQQQQQQQRSATGGALAKARISFSRRKSMVQPASSMLSVSGRSRSSSIAVPQPSPAIPPSGGTQSRTRSFLQSLRSSSNTSTPTVLTPDDQAPAKVDLTFLPTTSHFVDNYSMTMKTESTKPRNVLAYQDISPTTTVFPLPDLRAALTYSPPHASIATMKKQGQWQVDHDNQRRSQYVPQSGPLRPVRRDVSHGADQLAIQQVATLHLVEIMPAAVMPVGPATGSIVPPIGWTAEVEVMGWDRDPVTARMDAESAQALTKQVLLPSSMSFRRNPSHRKPVPNLDPVEELQSSTRGVPPIGRGRSGSISSSQFTDLPASKTVVTLLPPRRSATRTRVPERRDQVDGIVNLPSLDDQDQGHKRTFSITMATHTRTLRRTYSESSLATSSCVVEVPCLPVRQASLSVTSTSNGSTASIKKYGTPTEAPLHLLHDRRPTLGVADAFPFDVTRSTFSSFSTSASSTTGSICLQTPTFGCAASFVTAVQHTPKQRDAFVSPVMPSSAWALGLAVGPSPYLNGQDWLQGRQQRKGARPHTSSSVMVSPRTEWTEANDGVDVEEVMRTPEPVGRWQAKSQTQMVPSDPASPRHSFDQKQPQEYGYGLGLSHVRQALAQQSRALPTSTLAEPISSDAIAKDKGHAYPFKGGLTKGMLGHRLSISQRPLTLMQARRNSAR